MRCRRSELALLPITFLVAVLAGCGIGSPDVHEAVPASAWPDINGVTVVSSQGADGGADPGFRVFLVKNKGLDMPAVADIVATGLTNTGWTSSDCDAQGACFTQPGYLAILQKPDHQQMKRGIDLTVRIERQAT